MIRAALLCLLALPAAADPVAPQTCPPRDVWAAELKAKWGELTQFQGLVSGGSALLEVFAVPNGTWAMIVVRPDGSACHIAEGKPWIATGVPQGEDG